MCLQMVGSGGKRSEQFLYSGDEVQEGHIVDANVIPITHGYIDYSSKVLATDSVLINGHTYAKG
jgi:hypothetical protein